MHRPAPACAWHRIIRIVIEAGVTRLASVRTNHLSLTCSVCGHSALLPVSAAIDVFGETETVQHIVKRARCSRCRVKGAGLFQIVYVGQGWDALDGARTQNS
jgi:hypothetical protein